MGSDSGHWFSMDLFCPSTHNASGRDGMRMIKAGLACDALVPPLPHLPQSAACKLAANSLSALRLLYQNIFPPVHDILPPPPFLFSRDPQLCPFLLFSCELPLTFPAGSPRAAVSIVRLNSSRASSLRRPQCAASVLPRGPRPRPPPSRQWPPPLPGLPFIPPIGPLSRLPANPVVRWRGAALCAHTEEPARPGHQLDNGQL